LGTYGRALVVGRFALNRAARLQEEEYAAALRERVDLGSLAVDLASSALGVLGSTIRRKYQRWQGTVRVDDANARPLAHARSLRTGGAR
jgi:hypothetical protein